MARGKIISMADSGLSPESTIENTMKQEAMALREAKKPLVVEIRPTIARLKTPSPIKGDKKTLSTLPFQVKNGAKAELMLPIK